MQFFLLGSNIDPAVNLTKAIELLSCSMTIIKNSHIWITEAVGNKGPDFLNTAVEVKTGLNADQLRKRSSHPLKMSWAGYEQQINTHREPLT